MTRTLAPMSLRDHLRSASGRAGSSLAQLPREPARPWAVLACLDARMQMERLLGFAPGDAHVLRNAGAVVTDDVIRSLVVSSQLLGTREFALVAHTGCGLLGIDEAAARPTIRDRTGADTAELRLRSFTDLEAHVRAAVRRITECPWLPRHASVSGWIFDVPTGELREVVSGEVGAA